MMAKPATCITLAVVASIEAIGREFARSLDADWSGEIIPIPWPSWLSLF